MFTREELIYYSRQLNLPGHTLEIQDRLRKSKVLIVGIGGLGSPAAQYLAAAGIGTLGLIDDDSVQLHNLHRQILFSVDDIGQKKVITAKKKLEKLNPFITIETKDVRLVQSNCLSEFQPYDLILDCTDNYETRYMINDACVILNKPFVSGALFGSESQVAVFNLKTEPGSRGPTYRCLHPEAPAIDDRQGCADSGIIGVVAGQAGLSMANEAIKVITGIGKNLSGYLLNSNYRENRTELFTLEYSDKSFLEGPQNEEEFLAMDYAQFCKRIISITEE